MDGIKRSKVNYERDLRALNYLNKVRRPIVIDGCNILLGGSIFKNLEDEVIPDVLALLAVIRYFVINDFEVKVVMLKNFMARVNFESAMQELIDRDICILVDQGLHDDQLVLDIAANTNGVALTSDHYRDHVSNSTLRRDSVAQSWVGLHFTDIEPEFRFSVNMEEDFVAGRMFDFSNRQKEIMPKEKVEKALLVATDDKLYNMSLERRDRMWSRKWRDETVELLNNLIFEGCQLILKNEIM